MNKIIFVLVFLFLSAATFTFADQIEQVITLKDGSQIKGELSGVENGVYTVKTPSMGDVHVSAGNVASIANSKTPMAAPPVTPVAAPNMDQQIMAQQQKLMANPQAMADVQQIAQDPEIVQLLSDPALVQAVTSHDLQAIQNNPKIKELVNNPKMQALLKKLAAQQQQQNTSP